MGVPRTPRRLRTMIGAIRGKLCIVPSDDGESVEVSLLDARRGKFSLEERLRARGRAGLGRALGLGSARGRAPTGAQETVPACDERNDDGGQGVDEALEGACASYIGFEKAAKPAASPPRSSGSTDSSFSSDGSDFFAGGAGTVLCGRYRIVQDLGRGTFGRVVECIDVDPNHWKERLGLGYMRGTLRQKRSGVVAIKIVRNVERYQLDAAIEADILRKVNGSGGRGTALFPELLDAFSLPEGHSCLVFERLGMSLYDIIRENDHQPFSIECVRDIAAQLFDALDHMHGLGLIHTDIKLENVLLVSDGDDCERHPCLDGNSGYSVAHVPSWARIKIIDFGCATYDHEHKSRIVNTREYRAPEILLGLGWSFPSDIWATGCTVAELHLGDYLFPARNDGEHLALIEHTIGLFPRMMTLQSGTVGAKFFNKVTTRHKMEAVLTAESADFVRTTEPLERLVGNVAVQSGLFELLQSTLSIDPRLRPKAAKALNLCTKIVIPPTHTS